MTGRRPGPRRRIGRCQSASRKQRCTTAVEHWDSPGESGSATRESGRVTGESGSVTRESGSVTVETAVALSAIMVVLAMCLAGLACLTAALRVTDAAGQAARLAARGDRAGAQLVVQRLAPAGSALSLSGDDLVTAVVTAPPLGGLLPGVRVGATAVAAREPGEASP